jgi:hypothetical protein
MLNYRLCTHQRGNYYECPHFFILSRGKNAGRPQYNGIPNAFVVVSTNSEEIEKLYWIVYALWKAKRFEFIQLGSVIPFIKVGDVRNLIADKANSIDFNNQHTKKRLKLLYTLRKLGEHQIELVSKIAEMERTAAASL